MNYDIYMVGVGGQGLMTVGKILTETAYQKGIPVSFLPNKGMAQRGGFVTAQLRLGRALVSPNIPENMADLVLSEELSESLKALRYLRKGGDFVLSGEIWQPTAVMLGKAPYPSVDAVQEQIKTYGARLHYVSPDTFPNYQGEPAPSNLYLLGWVMKVDEIRKLFSPMEVETTIKRLWKYKLESALFAYHAGLSA